MRPLSMSTYNDSSHLHGKLFGLSKVASTAHKIVETECFIIYVAQQIIS